MPVGRRPGRDRSSSSSSTASGSATTRRPTRSRRRAMPTWRALLRDWPHATLRASEEAVGLPPGQMGNSEVGHLNLGAGRPVLQDLPRIDAAIADGSFDDRPALLEACQRATRPGGRLHIVSLVGPGGVHANDRHLVALAELAARLARPERPRPRAARRSRHAAASALGFVADLERRLSEAHPDARIATVGGRYYAMDRDRRWDRVERGYDAIVHGVGEHAPSAIAAIEAGLRPRRERRVRRADGDRRGRRRGPRRRPARPRQLPGRPGAPADPRPGRPRLHGFDRAAPDGRPAPTRPARRDDDRVRGRPAGRGRLPARGGPVAGPGVLGGRLAPVPRRRDREVRPRDVLLQRRGRGALSGRGAAARSRARGRDLRPRAGDERGRRHRRPGRGDRVGRATTSSSPTSPTRTWSATPACGTRRSPASRSSTPAWRGSSPRSSTVDADDPARPGALLAITADHGNADELRDDEGRPVTAHSLNPVPFVLVGAGRARPRASRDGVLADVAPTLLELAGLPRWAGMTGRSRIL